MAVAGTVAFASVFEFDDATESSPLVELVASSEGAVVAKEEGTESLRMWDAEAEVGLLWSSVL